MQNHFTLPGLENIVQKIVPNFNGTVTVFFTLLGQSRNIIVPHIPQDFDTTSAFIINELAKLGIQ